MIALVETVIGSKVSRMSAHTFPSFTLAQVVRMKISRNVEGLLVATSGDFPGRIGTARSENALADRIAETIRDWFIEQGQRGPAFALGQQ